MGSSTSDTPERSPSTSISVIVSVGCPQPELRHSSLICVEQLEEGAEPGGSCEGGCIFHAVPGFEGPRKAGSCVTVAVSDSFIVMRDGETHPAGARCRGRGSSEEWEDGWE